MNIFLTFSALDKNIEKLVINSARRNYSNLEQNEQNILKDKFILYPPKSYKMTYIEFIDTLLFELWYSVSQLW